MGRLFLLAAALSLGACHFYRVPSRSFIPQDEIEELQVGAAEDMNCPEDEIEVEQETLLTRAIKGCGRRRVYAWDPQREQWVLASVEKG